MSRTSTPLCSGWAYDQCVDRAMYVLRETRRDRSWSEYELCHEHLVDWCTHFQSMVDTDGTWTVRQLRAGELRRSG